MTEIKSTPKRIFSTQKFTGVAEGILVYKEWEEYLFLQFAEAECSTILDTGYWLPTGAAMTRDNLQYNNMQAQLVITDDERKILTQLENSLQKGRDRIEKTDTMARKMLKTIKDACGPGPLNIFDIHTQRGGPQTATERAKAILDQFNAEYSGSPDQIKSALDDKMKLIGFAKDKVGLVLLIQQLDAIRIQVSNIQVLPGATPINTYSDHEMTNWLLQRITSKTSPITSLRDTITTEFQKHTSWLDIMNIITETLKCSVRSVDDNPFSNHLPTNSNIIIDSSSPHYDKSIPVAMLANVQHPCWNFNKGFCKFGDSCKFSHELNNNSNDNPFRRYNNNSSSRKSNNSCNFCQQFGHFEKDCKAKQDYFQNKANNSNSSSNKRDRSPSSRSNSPYRDYNRNRYTPNNNNNSNNKNDNNNNQNLSNDSSWQTRPSTPGPH